MDSKYFDVDGFLRDYKLNVEKLKLLRYKYNAIPESTSMDYSSPKVSGGTPSSSVESKAARRAKLKAEMEKLEEYFDEYERLLNGLTDEERYITERYFRDGKKTRYDVDKMAQKLHCSTATMYRKIKAVRRKLKSGISGGE